MRFRKNIPAILLSILLIFDMVVAYRLLDQGWPKYVKVASGDVIQVVRAPFTWEDGLIAIAVAALHMFLIYLFRKSRRSVQPQH